MQYLHNQYCSNRIFLPTWAIIIWSIGAMIHALAIPIGEGIATVLGWIGIIALPVSVMGFMFGRAVLGFGESGNFPAAIKATAEYFPKKERSFATGIFNSGTNVGAILAPLTVPWIAKNWGWESAFIITFLRQLKPRQNIFQKRRGLLLLVFLIPAQT